MVFHCSSKARSVLKDKNEYFTFKCISTEDICGCYDYSTTQSDAPLPDRADGYLPTTRVLCAPGYLPNIQCDTPPAHTGV